MSDAISFAELAGHEVELLPARVVLTSVCFGSGGGADHADNGDTEDNGDNGGGEGGGDANLNANENTNTNSATASASIIDAGGLLAGLVG